MLGCEDARLEAIHAIALKAAISGSILPVPKPVCSDDGIAERFLFDPRQLANPACQPNAGPLRMAQDTLAG
jgi:hypothetical protein